MNTQAPTFKRTSQKFVSDYQASETLRRVGKVLSYCVLLLAAVMFLFHVFAAIGQAKIPIFSLFDGAIASRLFLLTLLLAMPAFYLLDEIKRRDTYTSKEDLWGFLDPVSRSVMVQMLMIADKQKTQLTPALALPLMLSSGYMVMIFGRLEVKIDTILEHLPQENNAPAVATERYQVSDLFKQYLQKSADRAAMRGDNACGLADLFLTYLESDQTMQQYFETIDITPQRFQSIIEWLSTEDHLRQEYMSLKNQRMHTGQRNQAWTSAPTPHLDHYSRDLTIAASYGAVPLINVRPKEVEESIRALSRAQKNSLLIVGEPGVGKTAIVERIALKMLGKDVPQALQDKRLVQLDTAALHADPSGFAAIFETIISEAERAGNVILYIPELQDLASDKSGGLASIELLLPILERGRMQIIGATTMREYHLRIENSASVSQSFAIVQVPEMDKKSAVTVLEENMLELESKHHVAISLKAVEAAVALSDQYIHDRALPEKAIEALDGAAVLASQAGRKEVTEADIRQVLSEATKVPLDSVQSSEKNLLLNLEQELHKQVVGQDQAVNAVAEALRRARAGLQDSNRPIGVFLFVGPTGVGKTELAKALARTYFKNEEALVRIDMSEFKEQGALDKLLGTATSEGLLTSPVRSKPFTLLLLDEFEKSSDEVRNIFLQIFDDGRATDGAGRVVDFKNTIIIATSNAGSIEIQQAVQQNLPYTDIQKALITSTLPTLFRPELLNRFDGVIVFKPLTLPEIKQITALQVQQVVDRIKASTGVDLQVTDGVINQLAQVGFDPSYGGRPLRRAVQDKLEGPLAKMVLEQQLKRGQELLFDVQHLAT